MSHPLDEEFGIIDKEHIDDFNPEVTIPENPDLDTIIDFAMSNYKEITDMMIHVEPKNRIRLYELGERYLNQAKDAIYKKDQLVIQNKKIASSNKKSSDTQILNEDDSSGKVMNRADLFALAGKS